MKRIVSIISLLVFSVSLSYASGDKFGKVISSCFHPSAKYSSLKIGRLPSQKELNGTIGQVDGELIYKGGFSGTRYSMKFITHVKYENNVLKYRIEPTMDTSSYPPSKQCKMRNWNNTLEAHESKVFAKCMNSQKKLSKKMIRYLGNSVEEVCVIKSKLFYGKSNTNATETLSEYDLMIHKLAELKNKSIEKVYIDYYFKHLKDMSNEIKSLDKK